MREPTGAVTLARELATQFRHLFGAEPRIFRAPGRVNLIGEHTDYNNGFVLPAGLDLATFAAIAPRQDRRLRIHSVVLGATAELDLDDPMRLPRRDWSDYVRGVAIILERERYRLIGADMLIGGNLPLGAGLSSSAALEVSAGYALLALSGATIDLIALAKSCQRAENEFVGMHCGIMDQMISCCAAPGHALLTDCRSLETRQVKVDPGARLIVANTMIRHELAASEYNVRRQECERAVALLSSRLAGIKTLRDITSAELMDRAALLPDVVFRRARHVISENARVLAAVAALEAGDLALCGQLMNASHASLRDDYEVSCAELDLMVELAQKVEGVFGARMTGGGFGGCTVNLVEANAVERFTETVGPAYQEITGIVPSLFCCSPGPGVGPVMI